MFGHFFIFMAYRVGPTRVVAPFYYTFSVWAVISGLLVFGQLPGPLAIGGIVLIVRQRPRGGDPRRMEAAARAGGLTRIGQAATFEARAVQRYKSRDSATVNEADCSRDRPVEQPDRGGQRDRQPASAGLPGSCTSTM